MRRCRRRGRGGQTLTEFALVAPLLLLVLMGCIDFGRYTYTRSTLEWDALHAGRLGSFSQNKLTDCPLFQSADSSGNGIVVTPDPAALAGRGSDVPSTPPLGQGYVDIYPAVSTATPQMSGTNCVGTTARASGSVTVTVTYQFVPWTPLMQRVVQLTIRVAATEPTEY